MVLSQTDSGQFVGCEVTVHVFSAQWVHFVPWMRQSKCWELQQKIIKLLKEKHNQCK